MKKLIWFLAMLAVLFVPLRANAQQAVHIASLEIDLWPEYDQPSMLIIYRVSLAKDTTLPANVNLRVPVGSQVNAVAVKDVDGQLLTITHTSDNTGGYQVLHFQVTLPDFQLEFYDPNLKKDGTQRTFLYTWPGDYAVDQVDVLIQQPFDATQTSIIPGPVTNRANTDGMTYFSKPVGSLSAGQSFKLEVGYQKPTDRLSAEFMKVQPSAPLPSQPTSTNTLTQLTQLWPWALGAVGVLLIAGGGYWYWRAGHQPRSKGARKRGRAAAAEPNAVGAAGVGAANHPTPADEADDADAIYCHQCGRRAEPADRFCRVCGTRLRTEHN